MDTMSPFSHQHDPDVALYQNEPSASLDSSTSSQAAAWSLSLEPAASPYQPRSMPAYISGAELQQQASSPSMAHASALRDASSSASSSTNTTPGTSISSRPSSIVANLPLLNPALKLISEDTTTATPAEIYSTSQEPSAFLYSPYLDPTTTSTDLPFSFEQILAANGQLTGESGSGSGENDAAGQSGSGQEDENEVDLDEAGPMEEGEQVLRLGNIRSTGSSSGGGAAKKAKSPGKPSAAAAKKRKASGKLDINSQKLLADVSDEEGKASGKKKIQIEYIQDKSRRHITFSKRKAGIMKKAYELSTLTGTQVLLLVVSETGTVFTYTTSKLQPLVAEEAGKALIRQCLDASDSDAVEQEHKHGGVVSLKTKGPQSIPRRPSAGNLRARRSAANLRAQAESQAQQGQPLPVPPLPTIPSYEQQQAMAQDQHDRQMQQYYYQQQQQSQSQQMFGIPAQDYMMPQA